MPLDSLPDIIRLVLALSFVVGLMLVFQHVMKRLGFAGTINIPEKKKRLKVVETLALDARRRLVLLQCDDKQHLVILGANSETVVDNQIEAPHNLSVVSKDSAHTGDEGEQENAA